MMIEIQLMNYNLHMERGAEHENKAYSFERFAKTITESLDVKRELYAQALAELINAQIEYKKAEDIKIDGVILTDAKKAHQRCEAIKAKYLNEHNNIVKKITPDTM